MYYFLSIALDTTYTHENVGLFVETDRMFYTVTAYGGSLRALNYFVENKISFKLGELDGIVSEFYRHNPDAVIEKKPSIIKTRRKSLFKSKE